MARLFHAQKPAPRRAQEPWQRPRPAGPRPSALWLSPGTPGIWGPGMFTVWQTGTDWWRKTTHVYYPLGLGWAVQEQPAGPCRLGPGLQSTQLSLDWGQRYSSSRELWAGLSSSWLQSGVLTSSRPRSLSQASPPAGHAAASRGSGSGIFQGVPSAQGALSPVARLWARSGAHTPGGEGARKG